MEIFVRIVKGLKPFITFAISYILDVSHSSEYASAIH